jgi:hypothetical protein
VDHVPQHGSSALRGMRWSLVAMLPKLPFSPARAGRRSSQ